MHDSELDVILFNLKCWKHNCTINTDINELSKPIFTFNKLACIFNRLNSTLQKPINIQLNLKKSYKPKQMADFNYNRNDNRHPRLLMHFQKQQRVPKLVSINQQQSQRQFNYQTQNSETQRQYYVRSRQPKIDKDPRLEAIRLERELQIQKAQKCQLQDIIKQLTIKSQRLKQINEHLIARLKEVQKSYIQNRSQLQKQNQQECRKLKNNLYSDVQSYVKANIQTLKSSLQGQKMNPKVQQKIQNFMQEMLQINSHSVQMLKISRQKQQPGHLNFTTEGHFRRDRASIQKLNLTNLSVQSTEKKSRGPERSEYQTLLKHLSGQKSKNQLTNSFYNSGHQNNFRTTQKNNIRYRDQSQNEIRNNSISRSMFRKQYSTTPYKRKKIFQRFQKS